MSGEDELDRFYAAVMQQIDVATFLAMYADVNRFVHAAGLTSDRRLARRRLKRLRDEIQPAAHFVVKHAGSADLIQFPLNSGPFDCQIWHRNGRHRVLQITVAQAKARLNLMQRLNQLGVSWGFIPLTDDQGKAAFEAAVGQGPQMHSPQQIQSTVLQALKLCLEKKSKAQGADTLLIETESLENLPSERWQEIMPLLSEVARQSPFVEVFAVSRDVVLALK